MTIYICQYHIQLRSRHKALYRLFTQYELLALRLQKKIMLNSTVQEICPAQKC